MFEYYTTSEAAEFLKVTAKTLRTWDKEEEFVPDRREGENRLYSRYQIESKLGMTLEEAKDPVTGLTESKIKKLFTSARVEPFLFEQQMSIREQYYMFYMKIMEQSTKIFRETKIGYANFILSSPEIGSMFEVSTAGFAPASGYEVLSGMNVVYLGCINRRWKLYTTAALTADDILIGIVKDKKICTEDNALCLIKTKNFLQISYSP